jgi:hypothetical protein
MKLFFFLLFLEISSFHINESGQIIVPQLLFQCPMQSDCASHGLYRGQSCLV